MILFGVRVGDKNTQFSDVYSLIVIDFQVKKGSFLAYFFVRDIHRHNVDIWYNTWKIQNYFGNNTTIRIIN